MQPLTIVIGVLTSITGVLVAWTAYRQYRLSAERFKLDLFEKRFAVYKGTQVFLSHILRQAKFEIERFYQFRADTQIATFLFDDDITHYLEEIDSKACEFGGIHDDLEGVPCGPERTELCKKQTRLLTWLIDKLPELQKVFSPYLKFRTWN